MKHKGKEAVGRRKERRDLIAVAAIVAFDTKEVRIVPHAECALPKMDRLNEEEELKTVDDRMIHRRRM